jgi:uncharacterized protein (TIGR02246 family)
VLLAVSTACNEESDAIGPRAADQLHSAPQAGLGAILADPILDIISAETAAWAAKDAAAYAASYAEDLRFINPAGVVFLGRDAFRSLHVAFFNGPFAGSTLAISVREIQFLTGTIAIAYLDEALTGYAFLPQLCAPSRVPTHSGATGVVYVVTPVFRFPSRGAPPAHPRATRSVGTEAPYPAVRDPDLAIHAKLGPDE